MTPGVVVDVGNTAIKWGRCADGRVSETCSLSPDGLNAWRGQAHQWQLPSPLVWVIAGVHPQRRHAFESYARLRGDTVHVLTGASSLPLRVLVDKPDHAGIDRLLDAVAANSRRPAGVPAVVIDAGSAVTVDLLDETGAFTGGAILPGLRLMAKALHDYTALLPLVEPPGKGGATPPLPGTATIPAIEAGIFWAVAGGVEAILREYRIHCGSPIEVFVTGGDGPLLQSILPETRFWPEMTLEGIRLSVEALP
ncbi:MAG TPA: type III pantothenate kinase [Gemmataceae bacterium]|nr:type III pantothenate kinase [Gemmataceae bacterium]